MMNILASWQRWAENRALKQAEQRAIAHSDEIDRQLREERRARREKADVLLIGSEAESIAFVKLMEFMQDRYTNDTSGELVEFRPVIWKKLLEHSRDIVLALHNLNLDHANRSTEANCEYITKHRDDTDNPDFLFLPRFAEIIQDLWTEDILPLLLDEPPSISFDDNATYFFAEAQRIVAEDYVPSIEDIEHIYEIPEKGVIETHLNRRGLALRVLRVNHGRQAWFSIKKWIPLFEGIANVMFIVSLADYDEPGIYGVGQTRLAEHLTLFESVISSPWFEQTSIILYLTGMAEFRVKLQQVPLNVYYPTYTGGTDADRGVRFIKNRFVRLNHRRSAERIYVITSEVSDVTAFHDFMSTVDHSTMTNCLRMLRII